MIQRTVLAAATILMAGVMAACSGGTPAPTTLTTPGPTTASSAAASPSTATPGVSSAPTPAQSAPTPAASAPAQSPAAASTPAPSAPDSAAPGATPAAAQPVVRTASIDGQGTLIVAAGNGMTVYVFSEDVPNSGTSACTDEDCLSAWPPLLIPGGTTPTGESGVTGKLGAIVRSDGTTQVTYNGLPLHFYSGDVAPGDTDGIYPNWSAVKP